MNRWLAVGLALLWAVTAGAQDGPVRLEVAVTDRGILSVEAEGALLSDLFREIFATWGATFEGMEGVGDERVTFSRTGRPEEVVKTLLQAAGFSSYALEFAGDRLTAVRVLPTGVTGAEPPPPETEEKIPSRFLDGARVVELTPEGQSRHLDLQPGDLILFYGGERVSNARELIRAVRATKPEDRVEMLLVRDRLPLRVYLNGGFIGVRIKNGLVENRGLDKFLP